MFTRRLAQGKKLLNASNDKQLCFCLSTPPFVVCFVNRCVAVLEIRVADTRDTGGARACPHSIPRGPCGSERSLLPRPRARGAPSAPALGSARSAGEGHGRGTAAPRAPPAPGGRRGPSGSPGRPGEGGAARGNRSGSPRPGAGEAPLAALSAGDGGRGLGVPVGGGSVCGAGRLASPGGARKRWNTGGSGEEEPQAQCEFASAGAAVEPCAPAASPGTGRCG